MSLWKCQSCGGVYNDANSDGMTYTHVCGPLPPDSTGSQAERPHKRDETIKVDSRGDAEDIVSVGLGVLPMQGQLTHEPEWIERMRAAAAARRSLGQ
jgi:hypothetical protein